MLRVALALATLLAPSHGWYNQEINAQHVGSGGASYLAPIFVSSSGVAYLIGALLGPGKG
jgi:hypothetical protein